MNQCTKFMIQTFEYFSMIIVAMQYDNNSMESQNMQDYKMTTE